MLRHAVRRFATAAQAEPDLAVKVFVDQQTKFRALVEGAKGLAVPETADAAAVSKFQADYDALRKKVGVPSTDERLAQSLSALREGTSDVRSFLTAAASLRTGAGVPNLSGADEALAGALDAVEKTLGKPLLFADAKGIAAFKTAAQATQSKLGLVGAKVAELAAASASEEAQATVAAIMAARNAAVTAAKEQNGLQGL